MTPLIRFPNFSYGYRPQIPHHDPEEGIIRPEAGLRLMQDPAGQSRKPLLIVNGMQLIWSDAHNAREIASSVDHGPFRGWRMSAVVPVDIRERAESAYTRARAKAILRHPALGDPTVSMGDYKPLCNTQVDLCQWEGCWLCGLRVCCRYTTDSRGCTGCNPPCCCKHRECFDIESGEPEGDNYVCHCGG